MSNIEIDVTETVEKKNTMVAKSESDNKQEWKQFYNIWHATRGIVYDFINDEHSFHRQLPDGKSSYDFARFHRIDTLCYDLEKGVTTNGENSNFDFLSDMNAEQERIRHQQRVEEYVLQPLLHQLVQMNYRFIVYKGGDLRYWLYDTPTSRHSGDLDLLIQDRDYGSITKFLIGNGFELSHELGSPKARRVFDYEVSLSKNVDGRSVWIDLHWNLTPKYHMTQLDISNIMKRSTLVDSKLGPYYRMDPFDHLGVLAWHAYDSAGLERSRDAADHELLHQLARYGGTEFRLGWIIDILLVNRHLSGEPQALAELPNGVARALAVTSAIAERLLPNAIGDNYKSSPLGATQALGIVEHGPAERLMHTRSAFILPVVKVRLDRLLLIAFFLLPTQAMLKNRYGNSRLVTRLKHHIFAAKSLTIDATKIIGAVMLDPVLIRTKAVLKSPLRRRKGPVDK